MRTKRTDELPADAVRIALTSGLTRKQMGLIDAPERSEGNQRRYTKDGLSRLSFIRHSRDLGLPLLAGVTAGLWAYETGTGPIGGFLVGAAAAGAVAIVGQLLFAFARPLWVRVIVAGLFAGPAAVAGYAATLGIARLAIPSETWQMAVAIIGAVAVGFTALFRMAGVAPPDPRTEMASEA